MNHHICSLAILLLAITFSQSQQAFFSEMSTDQWQVELSSEWNVLGPFPIHAREQHYLSPSFPLNRELATTKEHALNLTLPSVSQPIDYNKKWPSSYADRGEVGWSKTIMSPDGTIQVSFPEVRWEACLHHRPFCLTIS